VLTGSGGITAVIPDLERSLAGKQTGATVLYEHKPAVLVERLLQHFTSDRHGCSCYPEDLLLNA
jgi:hypothetical protein